MSLAIKYETVDDARMRLRGCVVLYKGQPVYINDVGHGTGKDDIFRVMFNELPITGGRPARGRIEEAADELKRKFISSKHFDIAPFRMGYVNREGSPFYCSRLPNRVQKQGLCNENFSGLTNSGTPVPFAVFTNCKEVPAMVAGDYPSFERALQLLDKVGEVAFHREFCLVKDPVISGLVFLYHKGKKVGMYTKGTGEIGLGKQFLCLRETLQEQRLKVGVA